ncbi:MAG: bifunctional hydroxymethylpyrimidine kinase/phosphomethylpyrimidine kinase [Candidatus Hydrogenedentes bacterium]|nr:bifunctional hydroxymethylpyrimidine kinase/phosphomethylpyrimidine kinase [Candidatus Hydrogenedentota bacterium]
MTSRIPKVLTIAGSDSGGGAGIQADLKTFAAMGVYGATAITAVTAQNTQGVRSAAPMPARTVVDQIDAVLEDIGADSVKTGMLCDAEIVRTVASALDRHSAGNLVVDPVMLSSSGHRLLDVEGVEALLKELLPLARIVTPNLPEAEVMSGVSIQSKSDMESAAHAIHKLGSDYVLITGGHADSPESVDYLYDGKSWTPYTGPRVETLNTHGTGCTCSAAIAAALAQGATISEAIAAAKEFMRGALENSLDIGSSPGPLDHGWKSRLAP